MSEQTARERIATDVLTKSAENHARRFVEAVDAATSAFKAYEGAARSVDATLSAMMRVADEEQRQKQQLRTRFGPAK